jgi:outer membrane protein assembly factor BamB
MFNVKKWVLFIVIALLLTTGLMSYLLISQGVKPIYASGKNAIHPQVLGASAGDWPTYQGDLGRSGFNAAETTITQANASQLKLHWTNTASGSISSQVAAVNGLLYWGSWDGIEHATNLSGMDVWTANLGQTIDSACNPPTVGVASTAAVATVTINGVPTSVVFVGGGNSTFYALDANSGIEIWHTSLGTPPANFLWSSPVVYNGSVYEGISSFGDCPLVRGAVVKMDASTGTNQNTFFTMPVGCLGASVWSSPTIDTTDGALYIATGNAKRCTQTGQMFLSMIKLNASDLSLIQFWQLPPADRFKDNDFGATPTLFTATIGGVSHNMVGVLNKNSKYYAFDRTTISQGPVWETQIANLGSATNISSSAWDGTTLYVASVATTINGTSCVGSVNALNPANGAFIWRLCQTTGKLMCPIVAAPGLLIIGQGRLLTVLDASSGATLFNFHESAKGGLFRAPIISNGVIYVGNTNGNLEAIGL